MAVTSALPVLDPPRARTVLVGTTFAVASVLMFFGGLFGVYFRERSIVRSAGEEWIPSDAVVELTPGTVIAWTLFISIVTMAWLIQAVRDDDRKHAYLAVAVNIMFAAAVINQTIWQYIQTGLIIDESPASVLIYTITGAHIAMMVVSILWLIVVGFRVLAGQYGSRQIDGIQAVAIWWFTTVFVYQIIWIGIWIGK